MGAEPDQGAEEYAGKQSAMNARHDAATQVILQVCGLSDLITNVEPKWRYACHRGTTRPANNPGGPVLGLHGAHAKPCSAFNIKERRTFSIVIDVC